MLAIVNVSPPDTPQEGENDYEIRVNNRVIGRFRHYRKYGNAAQCLRDAAAAVEKFRLQDQIAVLEAMNEALLKHTK